MLFTLDRRPLEAALQQAQAALDRDIAQAANAKAQAARYQDLAQRGIATREQVDQMTTNAAALDATVGADRAAVENAKVQLQYATIAAPIAGRTGALMVHEGNLVRANDTTPLVVINPGHADLRDVRHPRGAAARSEAVHGPGDGPRRGASAQRHRAAVCRGHITFVDNAVDQTTGTIKIKGTFPNDDRRLWPGQFVNVVVTLTTDPARHRRADGGGADRPAGHTTCSSSSRIRRSSCGRSPSARTPRHETVIDDGLAPGETVVTDGQLRLVPGSRVSIKPAAGRRQGRVMNLSALFIKRPVTTTLIMLGIIVFGVMAYRLLPVSDLPTVDFPTIQVSASLPGASPETMASAVALPLEKQFATIAGLNSINSTSSQGSTNITLQFDLSRNIDAAAQDVQSMIAKAARQLPPQMPVAAVVSEGQSGRPAGDVPRAALGDAAALARSTSTRKSTIAQRISMVSGVAQVNVFGAASTPSASTSIRASSRRTASASTKSPPRIRTRTSTCRPAPCTARSRRSPCRPTASCCAPPPTGR